MIYFTRGDILKANVEAIVNTVNCVGVMGRGIALQFKKAYPENFKLYADACRRGEVQPGSMFVFAVGKLTLPKFIVNFPTKRHWRGKSRKEDIQSGLLELISEIKKRNIMSIAIPPLGSGLGGLDWKDVRVWIEDALGELSDVDIQIFEPGYAPKESLNNASSVVPSMTPGRAALVGLIQQYIVGLMDPSMSLLEVHKLLYFMQEAGEPLRLNYVKAQYGPYAENLRHVLREIDGHFIVGYAGGGDDPNKKLASVPGAVDDANAYLEKNPETRKRFDQVAKLVDGFETPFGLELLATVHWIATKDSICDPQKIVDSIHAWGHRKLQFTKAQIFLAFDRLETEGLGVPSCEY